MAVRIIIILLERVNLLCAILTIKIGLNAIEEICMNIIRKITDKVSSKLSAEGRELSRISKIPRYELGKTDLLGPEFKFVDSISFLHGYEEIFLDKIYNFKASNKKPLIIDCGANIGLATIYLKKLYPEASVICFEPDPKIFEILKFNIESFAFKDVQLENKAISDVDGTTTFYSEGGFSGSINNNVSDNKYDVETQRLSHFLTKKVNFLKIDIEGAENFVIHEIQNNLPQVENIFIEYHSHVDEEQKLDEILLMLKTAGFRYHILEAFVRSEPFINRETLLGMDCQLNIIGFREN